MKTLFAATMLIGISLMLGSLFLWALIDIPLYPAQIGFLIFVTGFLLQKYHPKGAYHKQPNSREVKQE